MFTSLYEEIFQKIKKKNLKIYIYSIILLSNANASGFQQLNFFENPQLTIDTSNHLSFPPNVHQKQTNKICLITSCLRLFQQTQEPHLRREREKVAASTTRKVAKFKGHLHKFSPTAKETAAVLRFTVVPHSRALFQHGGFGMA